MKIFKVFLLMLWVSVPLYAQRIFRMRPINISITNVSDSYTEFGITGLPGNMNGDNPLYKMNNELFVKSKFRSAPAVQADVSLFGATFEGSAALINGVPFKSMQTGHHTFQLPISNEDIRNVSFLAPGALQNFGVTSGVGALNFNVKPKNEVLLGFGSFGDFDVYAGNGTSKVEYRRSDGYSKNTDYRLLSALVENKSILAGLLYKDFGAQDFYAPFNSFERISRFFLSGKTHSLDFKAGVLRDEFELKRDNPDFYKNIHNSYNLFLRTGKSFRLLTGKINTNLSGNYTYLDSRGEGYSTGMGFRNNLDVVLSCFSNIRNIEIGADLKENNKYGLALEPNIAVSFTKGSVIDKFTASYTRREPSFTERFYKDPVHYSNSSLLPEKNLQIQNVMRYKIIKSLLTYRNSSDAIDWVFNNSKGKYYSKNLDYQYIGFFLFTDLLKNKYIKIDLNYALQEYFNEVENTKYLFKEPKNKLSIVWQFKKKLNISGSFYSDNNIGFDHILSNLYLSKRFHSQKIALNIDNLFNIVYNYPTGLRAQPRNINVRYSYGF